MESRSGVSFSAGGIVSSGKGFAHQHFGAFSSLSCAGLLDESAAGASSQSPIRQCYGGGVYHQGGHQESTAQLEEDQILCWAEHNVPASALHIPGVEDWQVDFLTSSPRGVMHNLSGMDLLVSRFNTKARGLSRCT